MQQNSALSSTATTNDDNWKPVTDTMHYAGPDSSELSISMAIKTNTIFTNRSPRYQKNVQVIRIRMPRNKTARISCSIFYRPASVQWQYKTTRNSATA